MQDLIKRFLSSTTRDEPTQKMRNVSQLLVLKLGTSGGDRRQQRERERERVNVVVNSVEAMHLVSPPTLEKVCW